VIRRQDRYLMVEERPDGTPVINQPAGHLEYGETLTEAVEREVLEETGCRFSPAGLVGVYQWTLPGTRQTYLRFCFCGGVGDPERGLEIDPDIVATHWMSLDEISGGRLPARSPLVVRCIRDSLDALPLDLDTLHALL
jgi:8-oxo-dGTP pyrophosphatase MutT (NUDIX family)